MFSAISHYFFFLLINIDWILLLLVLISYMLHKISQKQRGKKTMVTCLFLFVALHILPVGRILFTQLENRVPQVTLPEHVDGLILLGGSFDLLNTPQRKEPVFNMAGPRLFEFIELALKYPNAKLLLTGTKLESTRAKEILSKYEIAENRFIIEDQSKNTHDNAQLTFGIAKPQPNETWVLVTSAFHMPRSLGLFRGQGWNVVPYSVNYLTSGQINLKTFLPDRLQTIALSTALKEWAGLINNYIQGKSPELFPTVSR